MLSLVLLAVAQTQTLDIQTMVRDVDPARLRATVEKLSSFHTRNTTSPTLKESVDWLADEYRKIPGLQVEVMPYAAEKSRRVPEEIQAYQVVAVLPGKTDRRILVGGHMDSLNLQEDAKTGRAPGANDDGSGTALALELARVMAGRPWNQTLVFVAFSGEEQGLLGSKALAERAKAEGWKLEAVFSTDIAGSSSNLNGQSDKEHVRVFSDDPDPAGENPQQSRELARFIEWATRGKIPGFGAHLVLRRDRFGRGGDHTSFSSLGFSAVRFTEVFEEFTRQHGPEDKIEYMDFEYLANVTRLNLVAMASLAQAAEAPTRVRYNPRQSHDTTLTWTATPGTEYEVLWRDSASTTWEDSRRVGAVSTATIEKVNKDSHFFAVAAIGGLPVAAR
ncbi:MAG: M20/M25/M40 family metallo-hydrolase [Fimbriimonadaceae bacterium]|nr:M20/M25/M40 family metallo-hydrolase [Chthonomonadaceae bacterium]MCO5297721.1 M20/M25/M40 family metallo-hydrolase [Fimbriimonadaceae bacterium]